jgi:hypothetical protein
MYQILYTNCLIHKVRKLFRWCYIQSARKYLKIKRDGTVVASVIKLDEIEVKQLGNRDSHV